MAAVGVVRRFTLVGPGAQEVAAQARLDKMESQVQALQQIEVAVAVVQRLERSVETEALGLSLFVTWDSNARKILPNLWRECCHAPAPSWS
jgi:hypothetical protein